jgi:hypothetical protein
VGGWDLSWKELTSSHCKSLFRTSIRRIVQTCTCSTQGEFELVDRRGYRWRRGLEDESSREANQQLKQGVRVSLDMTTLTIMRILPREVDPMVSRPIGRHHSQTIIPIYIHTFIKREMERTKDHEKGRADNRYTTCPLKILDQYHSQESVD